MAHKGKFHPKNPQKYKGDPTNIIYRSSWEFHVFRVLDEHPDVIWWQSEEVIVPYLCPIAKAQGIMKGRRYFPDVILKKRIGPDKYITEMIEIKPKAQTKPPDPANRNKTKTGRVSTRYLREVKTYATNDAKWKAAEEYCKDRGWRFTIMTEDDIKPLGK